MSEQAKARRMWAGCWAPGFDAWERWCRRWWHIHEESLD